MQINLDTTSAIALLIIAYCVITFGAMWVIFILSALLKRK